MRIGIAFDLVPEDRDGDGPDDRYEEFDKPETVEAIAEAIRGEGHDVALLGDGAELLRKVLDDPPDFVFNIAEGRGIGRCREARVPAALEMLGIPYSGSDPLTLAAALDKDVAKQLVGSALAGLRHPCKVPAGAAFPPDLSADELLRAAGPIFPGFGDGGCSLILKPSIEGSSKGIRGDCLAGTAGELVAIFGRLASEYRQPILVEEFIDGDEVTVGLTGNPPASQFVGAMRILPKVPCDRFVYSLEVKRDWARRVDYEAPARLGDAGREVLFSGARAIWSALGCRDVARIDFRIKDGVPYFIEANPLPGLAPGVSDLVILADGHGIGHAALIGLILRAAFDRVGLARAEPVAP